MRTELLKLVSDLMMSAWNDGRDGRNGPNSPATLRSRDAIATKLADGRGEGVEATDGLGGMYSIEYTGPHTIQLTPVKQKPSAEPHCHGHDDFDYDCIDCSDMLELQRRGIVTPERPTTAVAKKDCTCQRYDGRDCRKCFDPPYPDGKNPPPNWGTSNYCPEPPTAADEGAQDRELRLASEWADDLCADHYRAATPEESAAIDEAAGLVRITMRFPKATMDAIDEGAADTGLIRAAMIRSLVDYAIQARQVTPAGGEDGRDASLRRDIVEIYQQMPALPITAETMDAATDVLTRFCIDFNEVIAAERGAGSS